VRLCDLVDATEEDPFARLKGRAIQYDADVAERVAHIIAEVRTHGDEALLASARRFDSPGLTSIVATEAEWATADLSDEHRDVLDLALERVMRFHRVQLETLTAAMEHDGTSWRWRLPEADLSQRILPMASAGIYVPGGKGTYPSSVIMNAGPAVAAGVERVVVTTPARPDGTLHPAVLYAAHRLGVRDVVKVGGAAAVAALALGTQTVPRVDMIAGPGNRYVNEAKRQLWGQVGLDGYAGPSEVCVLVDDDANAAWAAADLLTQVEHAEDNAGFLVSLSRAKAEEVLDEAERQVRGAPREAILRAALRNHGLALVARDLAQACEIVDAIAPEHLTLSVRNPDEALARVRNAGCILLGEFTPESAGDFVLGPSHTLPTSGAARFQSPVNVVDFLKIQSVCRLDREQLEALLPAIEGFGAMEGFPAHARGGTIRFEQG
jgi:histidinol dehydrogenase